MEAEGARIGAAMSPRGLAARRGERALIRAAQGGDEEALEALYRSHWPRAHRAAFLIVHDAAASEDIAQEAFLAAVRALDRFDRRRPFGPWLHRIVVNRAIDWARRRKLRGETELTERDVGSSASAPDAAAARSLGDDVAAALAALPVEQRGLIVLRYLFEYTPGEIAAMLDLPRGTVNSRLRRGLDRLGELLEEAEP
jgi:RNA polymerase sigma-70 factor, ECF subfamily